MQQDIQYLPSSERLFSRVSTLLQSRELEILVILQSDIQYLRLALLKLCNTIEKVTENFVITDVLYLDETRFYVIFLAAEMLLHS